MSKPKDPNPQCKLLMEVLVGQGCEGLWRSGREAVFLMVQVGRLEWSVEEKAGAHVSNSDGTKSLRLETAQAAQAFQAKPPSLGKKDRQLEATVILFLLPMPLSLLPFLCPLNSPGARDIGGGGVGLFQPWEASTGFESHQGGSTLDQKEEPSRTPRRVHISCQGNMLTLSLEEF